MNDFIHIPYVNGGRDEQGCDCWGLTRLARYEKHPEKPQLPLLNGLDADDKRGATKNFYYFSGDFSEVEPDEGAIACAFIGDLCVHVGLIVYADYRLWVLETTQEMGVTMTRIPDFEGRYSKVKYYDN